MAANGKRQAMRVEDLAYFNMLQLEALAELLTEKGVADQTRDTGAD
jgi:hypothetical protein